VDVLVVDAMVEIAVAVVIGAVATAVEEIEGRELEK